MSELPKNHKMTIAGLERELPLCAIDDRLEIAAFILFGDVEMTIACAEELLRRSPAFDIILTPEAKSIPLAYEMARQSGKPYIVARKGPKLYMNNPVQVSLKSITTEKRQSLFLSGQEAQDIRGRRVLLVDDVISTGDSLRAMESLIEEAGGRIVAKAAVLAEGEAAKRKDILYLEPLPLFLKEN